MIDVAIIGGGPAALSAAIYCGRAGLQTVVFEKGNIGGELSRISHISNYPGFIGKGETLAQHFRKQAEESGVQITYGECREIRQNTPQDPSSPSTLDSSDITGDQILTFTLQIDNQPVMAHTVLIATGSQPRTLGFEVTPPVSYCALCDADFAKDKHVAIIGGGNSAAQEALYLAPLVKDLDIITHSALKADHILRTKLANHANITIREHTEPIRELLDQYDYIFVFIGNHPSTGFLQSLTPTVLNEKGYVLTGNLAMPDSVRQSSSQSFSQSSLVDHDSLPHTTVIPGLFAAGDVRSGCPKQVVCAAGDGAAAAVEIIHLLQK